MSSSISIQFYFSQYALTNSADFIGCCLQVKVNVSIELIFKFEYSVKAVLTIWFSTGQNLAVAHREK